MAKEILNTDIKQISLKYYDWKSDSGCRLLGYLILFATYTLVRKRQEYIEWCCRLLLFDLISKNFIPPSDIPQTPIFLEIIIIYLIIDDYLWSACTRCLLKYPNASPSVLPRLLAQNLPGLLIKMTHSVFFYFH